MQNYTVFAAIDEDGIVGIQIVKKYSKSIDCLGFLNQMLQQEKTRYEGKKTLIFMDNARQHLSLEMKEYFLPGN